MAEGDAQMKRTFPIFFALLILGGGVRGEDRNTKAALHDRAQMFSKGADEEVDQYLRKTERETGYQVIIETVDSLKGEPIEERAQAGAKSADLGMVQK